jgi:hypothetical protein
LLGVLGKGFKKAGRKEGENEMKVLIVIERSPKQRFLIELHTKALAKEVRDLVNNRKHTKSITTAFSKGRFQKEVEHHELPGLKADLILSENSARWDLTK